MKKQSFTILLVLLINMISTKAFAYDIAVQNADGVTIYYNYINDGNELEVTNSKYLGNVVIPEEVTYMSRTLKVTRVGDYAFDYCTNLTSVTIPNSVISIGDYAFYDCSGLKSVTIPNSVTSIGYVAFCGCNGLTSINIGNSVTSIGVSAFYDCSGLTSVTIPNSVTSIGYGAFSFCRSLASISVGSGNAIYDSRDNCNAIIETSTNTLICGCQNTIIPNSVTNIDVYALLGCLGLTSITISNNVKSIGNGAFSYCTDLESITIALGNAIYDSRDNCNAIIETATNTLISGCKNTIIPNSITSIGEYSFFGCLDLTSVTIPYSVKSIGDYAFRECSGLKSVTIPNSVKSIGQQAFFDSSVTSVTIGNNVKSIDRQAFFCPIENVYCYAEQVPNATIGSNPAFYHKTIANATLHVPATSIDDYKAAETWKEFGSIVALTDEDPSPTGITNIYQDSATERQYYSLDGKRSSTPLRGLNIIKMSNGTTRKVVIR